MAKKALIEYALIHGKVAGHLGLVRPATGMKQTSAMKSRRLLTGFCG